VDNIIRMVLKEIMWKGVDWIYLVQHMGVIGSCEHGNEPWVQ
jgi:hypothetical protein